MDEKDERTSSKEPKDEPQPGTEKSPSDEKEVTIFSNSEIQAWQLAENLETENTVFRKGGFLIFKIDDQLIDPPMYIEQDQFNSIMRRVTDGQEENG